MSTALTTSKTAKKPTKTAVQKVKSSYVKVRVPKTSKVAAPQSYVIVDYPKNGERIAGGHYAVRVSALAGELVQISLNGETWNDCRPSAGYYWHDLTELAPGEYKCTARIQTSDGKYKKSKTVQFTAE